MRRPALLVLAACTAAALALDMLARPEGDGGLLLALLAATALAHGGLAIAAAGQLAGARWLAPLRADLLALWPLALVPPLVLAALGQDLSLYPWQAAPGEWLNANGYLGRGVGLLALTAGLGAAFAWNTSAGHGLARPAAALYLLAAAVTHGLGAVDWVMSLEPHWSSTLFPLLAVIEVLAAGVVMTALVVARRARTWPAGVAPRLAADAGLLLAGLGLIWGWLQFAQYLTIWAGNVPEYSSAVARRLQQQPTAGLAAAALVFGAGLPFLIGVVPALRRRPGLVALAAVGVLIGLLSIKAVYLLPAVALAPGYLAAQLGLLLAPFAACLLAAPAGAAGK